MSKETGVPVVENWSRSAYMLTQRATPRAMGGLILTMETAMEEWAAIAGPGGQLLFECTQPGNIGTTIEISKESMPRTPARNFSEAGLSVGGLYRRAKGYCSPYRSDDEWSVDMVSADGCAETCISIMRHNSGVPGLNRIQALGSELYTLSDGTIKSVELMTKPLLMTMVGINKLLETAHPAF